MTEVALQFRAHIGHDAFDKFYAELEQLLYANILQVNIDTAETDLLKEWIKFSRGTEVENIELPDLALLFLKQWPPPLDEEHIQFYRDEIKSRGVGNVAKLLHLSDQIGDVESLMKNKDSLMLLSDLLDGQSAADLFEAIRRKSVFEGPWRSHFISMFPESEKYLPPCATDIADFKRAQINAVRERLMQLSSSYKNDVFHEIFSHLIRVYEQLLFMNDVEPSLHIGPALTEDQIGEREHQIGFKFPGEFKEVLLAFSGNFSFDWCLPQESWGIIAYNCGLLSWNIEEVEVMDPYECGIAEEDLADYGWFKALELYSTDVGDKIALGLEGAQRGKVYFYDHGIHEFSLIESDFTSFLLALSRRDFANLDILFIDAIHDGIFDLNLVPTDQLEKLKRMT